MTQTTKERVAPPQQRAKPQDMARPQEPLPNGRAAAAILAAAIGCLAFGLLTVLAGVFKFLRDALRFYHAAP